MAFQPPPLNDTALEGKKDDFWSAEKYGTKVAPFVAQMTDTIVGWLDPKPEDIILDIGCGDGVLTARIAPHCASITGVDASPNLLAASRQKFPSVSVHELDCGKLLEALDRPENSHATQSTYLAPGVYTKIFSNAALHWILRGSEGDERQGQDLLEFRRDFYRAVYRLLQPGGAFVAECGALGNVAEVHAGIVGELIGRGVPPDRARQACPWWFASEEDMKGLVQAAGLVWEQDATVLRQTKLTEGEGGGLRGWINLFGAHFKSALKSESESESEWEAVVENVAQALESVGRRGHDGGFQVNYVRLRFVARKPAL